MKKILVNYRQPNIDRFLEIMAVARFHDMPYDWEILSLPRLYEKDIQVLLDIPQYLPPANRENILFTVSYPEMVRVDFHTKYEPFHQVRSRVISTTLVDNSVLDGSAYELLKNAVSSLLLTVDEIQAVLDISAVIASMEGSTIQAHHLSEAVIYLKKLNDAKV